MKSHKLLRVAMVMGVIALAFLSTSTVLAAPANDNFANATQITALPFNDSQYTWDATLEQGEPTPGCFSPGSLSQTLWYRYSAFTSKALIMTLNSIDYYGNVGVGVWTGSGLGNLSSVACLSASYGYPSRSVLRLEPGKTYYFQAGVLWNYGSGFRFSLDIAPPPTVSFSANPYDPSVFDTVYFYNYSYDPAGQGFKSWAWTFGDGSTSTVMNPTHRYAMDGDYKVTLAVTTIDNRTGFASQTISVRTHDVSIIKFTVPNSGSAGQTRHATVEIKNNTAYGETVRVELYKSVAGGYQLVGSLLQSVPARSSGNTVSFDFSYTFTTDDAVLGKVTFKAVASLVNARDALPADNEVIALPTKVSK